MAHIYEMTEWQGGSGHWYCNDLKDISGGSGAWWVPARMLDMELTDFVLLLINTYKVSHIHYSKEKNFLCYSWDSQSDMRKFKNFINKRAREINYVI